MDSKRIFLSYREHIPLVAKWLCGTECPTSWSQGWMHDPSWTNESLLWHMFPKNMVIQSSVIWKWGCWWHCACGMKWAWAKNEEAEIQPWWMSCLKDFANLAELDSETFKFQIIKQSQFWQGLRGMYAGLCRLWLRMLLPNEGINIW